MYQTVLVINKKSANLMAKFTVMKIFRAEQAFLVFTYESIHGDDCWLGSEELTKEIM